VTLVRTVTRIRIFESLKGARSAIAMLNDATATSIKRYSFEVLLLSGVGNTIFRTLTNLYCFSMRQKLETRLTPPQQFNPFMVAFFRYLGVPTTLLSVMHTLRELHLHDASASFHVSIAVDIRDIDPRDFSSSVR
jgi:hypothetical protein